MKDKIFITLKKVFLFILVAGISLVVLCFAADTTGLVGADGFLGTVVTFAPVILPIVLGVAAVKKKYPKATAKAAPVPQADVVTTLPAEQQKKADSSVKEERQHAVKVYPTEKTYRVAGTSFRLENIAKLGVENQDYFKAKSELIDLELIDEKIWKYEFYSLKAEVIPEPDNPADPNAIMVWVNGQHVGYIKAGSCAHLLKVIKGNRIRGIDCDIRGGPYKVITEDYDVDEDREFYQLEKGELNYSVVLHIFEEPAT